MYSTPVIQPGQAHRDIQKLPGIADLFSDFSIYFSFSIHKDKELHIRQSMFFAILPCHTLILYGIQERTYLGSS